MNPRQMIKSHLSSTWLDDAATTCRGVNASLHNSIESWPFNALSSVTVGTVLLQSSSGQVFKSKWSAVIIWRSVSIQSIGDLWRFKPKGHFLKYDARCFALIYAMFPMMPRLSSTSGAKAIYKGLFYESLLHPCQFHPGLHHPGLPARRLYADLLPPFNKKDGSS